MQVVICGGRSYCDLEALYRVLDTLDAQLHISVVMTGGCSGADQLAELWANARGKVVKIIPARWDIYGRAAGPIRNSQLLDEKPDLVIAFQGGRGTADIVRQAEDRGIAVKIVE